MSKLKSLYLILAEFFAGVSVMAVEIGANRLLAPYFSSSQIVWTIIIGTIMIAMALGNVWGGRAADRDPDPSRLFRRMLVAAVWIAAIPALGKYVIIGIAGLVIFTVSGNYLIWAALAACLVVFVFPLFLLGTTTPSLARYTMKNAADAGKAVGRLEAANTIGSILGTFLPTFVTIPAVGTSLTFIIFGAALLILALIWLIPEALRSKKARLYVLTAVCLVLFVVFSIFGRFDSFAFWEEDLTYEGESVYNYLQVKESPRRVSLSTNVLFGVQSVAMKDGPGLTGLYYDTALAAPLMTPGTDDLDVLILGNGTGTYAMQLRHYFPGCRIDAVEIDDRITALAYEYFGLDKNDPDIAVFDGDGRAFINSCEKSYDVIMVDAYQDITIPFSMSSAEFFTLVREHLNPGGAMVVNMNMRSGEGGINARLCDTMASVFPTVMTADVGGSTNREVFCSADPRDEVLARCEANVSAVTDAALSTSLRMTYTWLEDYAPTGGGIFTDDRAPVELLGMEALDLIIGDEISYYKDVYEESGITGLIDMLG